MNATTTTIVREITIEAPAAKIFAALTEPAQLTAWWGSDDSYRCTHMESDVRVGGEWRTTGKNSTGNAFAVTGTYRVVEPPHVLEMTWRYDHGESSHEDETVVRYELEPHGASTLVRVIHSGFPSLEERDDHDTGWARVLGWLQTFVERP